MSVAPYEGRFGPTADLRRLTGGAAVVNGVYQLGLAAVALLRGLAVAAFVTREEYGLWGLVGLALWTALALRYLGVNDRYVQQSEGDQELAFQRGFTVELVFALLATVALAALIPAFAALTGHASLVAPGLVLVILLPAGALQFPIWSYYRRMDFRRLRALQAVEPIVATVVTIALAAAGAGYWSFVAGVATGAWAGALAAVRHSLYPLALRWDPATVRSYLSFSAPVAIAGISTLAIFLVIYLVGNGPLGLAGLGAFTLAGNVLMFTHRADGIITDALYPALCAVRDRTAVLFEAFIKSNRLALMWAVPFGVGLSLFASDLVRFAFGPRWSEAIGLLQVMGALAAVQHLGFNWHAFYLARGQTWPIAVTAVAGSAALIAAAIPLMQADGLAGLGWAFLIAEGVSLSLRTVFLRRLFPGFRMAGHMARAIFPTAVIAGSLLALRTLESGDRTASLAVAELVAYAAATAVATLLVERSLLREAVGYVVSRPVADA
jgi:O-antigen/teichoic acid export membrane protein